MHLIVGDIHGCWDELRDLLDRVGPGPDDTVLAVGDIVDRGPGARRVYEFFRDSPRARSILGNHERKHLRAAEGRVAPALSQRITREELGADYPAFLALVRTFPLHAILPEAIVVHGFFEPGVPLERQRDTVVTGTLSGEAYLRKRLSRPWYELYEEGPPIIVGHRNYSGSAAPFVHRDRVYGIDTHCYGGGALTGLVLPGFRLVSVPARARHWEAMKARYAWILDRDDRRDA